MSGQTIQNKLYKAYGKVAKKLGTKYDVYRIDTLTYPFDGRNWLASAYGAFSSDTSFSSPLKSAGESILAWINAKLTTNFELQVGDFLYDHDSMEAFVVDNQHLNKPMTAIQLTDAISIYRSTYQDSGDGYQPEDAPVVENYPAVVTGSGGSGGGFFIPSSTIMSAGIPSWKVTLWAPSGSIHSADIFVDTHGNKTQVMTFEETGGMYTIYTSAFHPQ